MTDTANVRKADPVLVAVLDTRFDAIVEQVAGAMVRTSMSPIFAEARDLSAAVFDKDLRLIAQRDWLPVLASNLPAAIKNIAGKWGENVHEGDVFIHNDPFGMNSHIPDINIAKPIFYKGQLEFWVVAKGHNADVGGRGLCGYDPTARTTWDDGLTFRALKLYNAGVFNKDLMDVIKANTKLPDLIEADLDCEVGACVVGERDLVEVLDHYGIEAVYACLDEIMDATERGLRAKIEQIADGVYCGEKAIDDDAFTRDVPVTVRAKVTKKGSDITIDLSESDPQAPSFVNSTLGNTFSVSNMAILYFMEGDTKRNEGALRPVKVITKKGTVVDPEFPAATTMCTCTQAETIFEAVMLALADTKPEWATGAHGKMDQFIAVGLNPDTQRPFAMIDFFSVAQGSSGTMGYDGWPMGGPSHCMGQLRSPDPEVMELTAPFVVWQFEMAGGNSMGAGQYRGGSGMNYRAEWNGDAAGETSGQGHVDYATPSGLFGGTSPAPCLPVFTYADGKVVKPRPNVYIDVKRGMTYEITTQGGAGWGDPFQRDPKRVLRDVKDELYTAEEAKNLYGVVVVPDNGSFKVDEAATSEARASGK